MTVDEGNLISVDTSAGDHRFDEMPGLMSMHALWVREHNRLAKEIKKSAPGLSDEILYQEARRLVIAQMQNIVYNEYLPIILGPSFRGVGSTSVFGTEYESNVDPSIENGFATAAFRFGHSMIQGLVQTFMASTRSFQKAYQLRDNFFVHDNYVAGKRVNLVTVVDSNDLL